MFAGLLDDYIAHGWPVTLAIVNETYAAEEETRRLISDGPPPEAPGREQGGERPDDTANAA